VVHGPLLATLLLDLARHEAGRKAPAYFSFRARRPVVDTAPFDLNAEDDGQGGLDLWVRDAEGAVAMTAEARTRSP
jgi:3-methylfumaryl-CoA hydratase